jgi:HAD superfamily hydrolase (TIGR01509 family)
MSIRWLLLDLGEVLIDLDLAAFHSAVTSRLGREVELGNATLHHDYMRGKMSSDAMRQKIAATYGLELSAAEFPAFWAQMLGPERLDLLPLLREVQQALPTALCSNTDRTHIAWLEANDCPMLKGFTSYCYSFDLAEIKPDKAYFHAVLERLGATPQQCRFLDDNAANVAAANALGIDARQTPRKADVKRELQTLLNEL